MNISKNKGPIFDPGLCRCCGYIKKCRIINTEYEWQGQKEIYSDMFMDCFGLMLSNLDGDPKERLICATCVCRLREACSFRQQVLQCEERLLQKEIVFDAVCDLETDVKIEISIKNESNTCEGSYEDDTHYADDVTDEDDKPLKKIKEMKKETRTVKKSSEAVRGKREMLRAMKRMKSALKKLENKEEKDSYIVKPLSPPMPITITSDSVTVRLKASHNTATIVENSYVCPFTTPYSSDYYCIYCREKFVDPVLLREHNLNHDPKSYRVLIKKKFPQIDISRIDCRLCNQVIDDLKEFKKHITRVHGKKLFSNVPDEFLKFKLKLNNFVCTECNAVFSFFLSLKKHMAQHFGTYICDVCGAHYFQEQALLVHQKTHQKNIETFACEECGKEFKSKYSRHLHIATIHTKEPVHQCSKCDQVFFTKTLRYKHMKEVHGENKDFKCGQCDRVFDRRRCLTEHYRKSHTKCFKHQCDVCHKKFYMPCQLKEHMLIHTGERNYRCDLCGKTYVRPKALKLHMQTHNGDKKYVCDICSATFTQNGSLKNHYKKQHQGLDLESYHE